VSLDERAFFTDKPETRPAKYSCPRCRRTNEYAIRFVRRVKRDRLPQGADERDRAKFAKLRDHLLRLDDEVTCKTCGKKFEIPSLHSLQFVDQIEGLPKDVEELDEAPASAPVTPAEPSVDAPAPQKKPLPARFTRPTKGWRG
jgi:DNA-directed RNA polymerase subunit RPC12/RpoP